MEEKVPTKQGVDFRYLSRFNVANFITIKLSKTNCAQWMKQILSLVDILELRDFLTKEPPISSQEKLLWEKTDVILQSWILGSITEDVYKMLEGSATLWTSRSIIIKIEKIFATDINQIISPKPAPMPAYYGIIKYMPLYKAAVAGDWETAKSILDTDENAATAMITENGEGLLHVAVKMRTRKAIHFLESLVQHFPADLISLPNKWSIESALLNAIVAGNIEAVKILVKKHPVLITDPCNSLGSPLPTAIMLRHKDIYLYLLSGSSDYFYTGSNRTQLLHALIVVDYVDLALDLVTHYPPAAEPQSQDYILPLNFIAVRPHLFRSGMSLNFLESFIYSCVPVKIENHNDTRYGGHVDIENPSNYLHRMHFPGGWNLMLWDVIGLLVPSIKNIRQKKLVHHQAIQLVRYFCEAVKPSIDDNSFCDRKFEPITFAAGCGSLEVVEEILDILPHTIWACDRTRDLLQLAILNRCEKVFNRVCQMTEFQQTSFPKFDDLSDTNLHLAGRLAPPHKLSLISGAALQMQRELQWFKEVETLAHPMIKTARNNSGDTPARIFTREHKELVIEGEKWMKETANSYTIATALIITVVFAAAITVPGGNRGDNGKPLLYSNPAFLIFAISDTFSLFMSTTSLLMFLSILTARYKEQDFLDALPKRLVLGLLTLFLSVTLMLIAFSAAVFLVFGGGTRIWVAFPLVVLSCLAVTSFMRSQFPLLIDVYSSTYGHGIFAKQSDHPYYLLHITGLLLEFIVKCFAYFVFSFIFIIVNVIGITRKLCRFNLLPQFKAFPPIC